MPVTGRVRDRVLDPVLAGVVALVVYSLHGFDNTLGRDQATFVYGGVQLAHGTPPYRGIFNSVGPLGDMVSALGTRIGWLVGLDALTGARLAYLAASVLCVAGLSVLAREALQSRVAGLLAPAAFLTFASFLKLATGGPREKTVMVLFLELALVLLLRRRWFAAGAGTALATLAWQPVILAATSAAVVAILTSRSRRLRPVAAYVVGGALVTGLFVGYFLAAGVLRVAWWGFVEVNVGYTRAPTIVGSLQLVVRDYRWSLLVVLVGLAGLLGLAARAAVRARRTGGCDEASRELGVLGVAGLVATLWSCYSINGGADLFVVLPFAAVGIAALALELGRRATGTVRRRMCAVLVAVAVVSAGVEAVATRDPRLPDERRDVTAMVGSLPRGSVVLSVSAPEVLVLAHRRNPYPWQLSDGAISAFLDDHLAAGLAGYADRISRLHPALIAVGHFTADAWLRPVLQRRYRKVGSGDHWAWYAARSLGPSTLNRLRDLNQRIWAAG